jgi:hypothetical protein
MNIMIESVTETEHGRYYRLTADKTTMTVSVTRHSVTTCVENASHAAYRSAGKTFHGADALIQATGAYKSSACKAILETIASAERAIVNAGDSTVEA